MLHYVPQLVVMWVLHCKQNLLHYIKSFDSCSFISSKSKSSKIHSSMDTSKWKSSEFVVWGSISNNREWCEFWWCWQIFSKCVILHHKCFKLRPWALWWRSEGKVGGRFMCWEGRWGDGEMCGCPPGSAQSLRPFTHPIWGQRRERKRELMLRTLGRD